MNCNKMFVHTSDRYYCYENEYGRWCYGSTISSHNESYQYDNGWYSSDEEFEAGDEVTMELDTRNKTLMYYRNGTKIKNWFENIKFDDETVYNMAICAKKGEYCVELTDFKIVETRE